MPATDRSGPPSVATPVSWASSPGNRRSMQGNKSRDTRPEVRLRSKIHRAGLRFRKHARPVAEIRCTADFVFPSEKLAVFFDGCWWHSCPLHGSLPKTNRDWWEQKLRRNVERDGENDRALTFAGWTVLRVWEHEPIDEAVDRIVQSVHILRNGDSPPRALIHPRLRARSSRSRTPVGA